MTRKQLIFAGVLPLVLAIGTSAGACLWDSDTLQMERLRFPGVLEIITGKFVRHSPAYYEWRIKDRLKKLEATPDDPALIDDLAVGYDKLGRYDEGIAVLEKSLAADPNRYETLANLATLLFHAGRLEESKQHVQRALEINPYAHFGREKYQLLLTEYVLQSELNSAGVLSTDERYPMGGGAGPRGFARYVIVSKYGEDENLQYSLGGSEAERGARQTELQDAAKGVLGMLHFADHESPVLLEALGDLLITGELDANGTRLGARAFLRAAQMSKDAATADRFRRMAHDALANQLPYGKDYDPEKVDLSHLEKELAAELTQGAEFFSQIEARERQWIDTSSMLIVNLPPPITIHSTRRLRPPPGTSNASQPSLVRRCLLPVYRRWSSSWPGWFRPCFPSPQSLQLCCGFAGGNAYLPCQRFPCRNRIEFR